MIKKEPREMLELIRRMIEMPGRPATLTDAQFLKKVGETDGAALAWRLLREATTSRSAALLDVSLFLSARFGFDSSWIPTISGLLVETWHEAHEELVDMLSDLATPETVPGLLLMTQFIPPRREWDESRSLARRAIWALGALDGEVAGQLLVRLSQDPDERIRGFAQRQLDHRDGQQS